MAWNRSKPQYRGGYYLHLSPGNSFLACGFWGPNPEDMHRVRQELSSNAQELRSIISDPNFYSFWGELKGDALKTAPRGVNKMHPDIDLIRKKQYIFSIPYSNKQVCDKGFIDLIEKALKESRPFLDYMSDVLTTNTNGESIL